MKLVGGGGELCNFRISTSPDYILIYGKTAAVLSQINLVPYPRKTTSAWKCLAIGRNGSTRKNKTDQDITLYGKWQQVYLVTVPQCAQLSSQRCNNIHSCCC